MQLKRLVAASTALMLTVGCTSTTVIRSEPSGANLYIDGSKMGKTPYTYSDTKIVGSTTHLKLTKEGYEEFDTVIRRDEEFQVGPCIGGVFVLFPLLWVMGYRPEHVYELTPEGRQNASQAQPVETAPGSI
jgi:PEGA domain